MADVLAFPKPYCRLGHDGRLRRLRDIHDGFRAAADICELAAKHQDHMPSTFLDGLYVILSREGDEAERKLANGITIDLTAERPDEPA